MARYTFRNVRAVMNLRFILLAVVALCYIPGYAQYSNSDYQPNKNSKEERKKLKEKEQREKEKRDQKEKARIDKEKKAAAQLKTKRAEKPDTFSIVHHLIARRKFRKASVILGVYHHNHPTDLNSIWLQAQAELWLGNFDKSNRLYNAAIKIAPENDYLKLNYIHSLLDMGRRDSAGIYLDKMEKSGSDYPDMSFLHAQIYFWSGDYDEASAYVNKAMELDNKNTSAHDLSDEILAARAPKISLNSGYLTDNQPYTALISSLKYEQSFNRFLSLYVEGDDYHFIQPGTTDAPWIKAGDKLYFPKAGLQVSLGGGAFKFPVKNQIGWSANLDILKKISPSFDLELVGDEVPYFDTKSSVDTNITATKGSMTLYWHHNKWLGQAAVLGSMYAGNAYVYSGFAWVMAPIATFSFGQFMLGYSSSYSNSNVNSYSPQNSLSEILNNPNQPIAGLYNPYFTPDNLFVNAALASLSLNVSTKVTINLNGDLGYGLINNPYLYLNAAGNSVVKGYQVESFTPADFTFAFNYHIDKTFLVSAKYIYRSTYFFSSNYVGIGIEKSFWHSKQVQPAQNRKSAFMKRVGEIEQKIQWLYSSNNPDELKASVGKIKNDLATLRDAQLKSKNTTEILPNSDQAALLQDRYQSLNEMINEINAVDLNDSKDYNGNIKQWLVDKLYELTSISYDGSFEEQ